MKRQLKFRAWNTIVQRMQYFDLPEIERQSGAIQWHILDIMQFTGMKDINGKDIYEGDICRSSFNVHGKPSKDIVFNSKIVYNEYIAQFQISYSNINKHFVNDTMYSRYFLEVIGNIHQNPELI